MKNYSAFFLTCFFWVSFSFTACDKDPVEDFTVVPPPLPPSTPTLNPIAHAGLDVWVGLPVDTAILYASFSAYTSQRHTYLWKQVAGPNTALIKNQETMAASVSQLQKGTYEFEFTVTDISGLWDKDTVSVFVQEFSLPTHAEVLFTQQAWSCPMGCWLIIDCLPCYIPVNKAFKVYVKEGNTTPWIEVVPEAQWTGSDNYVFEVDGGKLMLYAIDQPTGRTDIKIVY